MKIDIGKHEFSEVWDGVFYKALSDYPVVSNNEMKDMSCFRGETVRLETGG